MNHLNVKRAKWAISAGLVFGCLAISSKGEQRTSWFDGMVGVMPPQIAKHKTVGIRSNWAQTDEGESVWDFGMGMDMAILHVQNEDRRITLGGRWCAYSRFQYDSDSFDLWTTDFRGGLALGYGFGRIAIEAFVFHESSHLGDEIQERGTRIRRDVSKNGVRLLAATQREHLRLYGGLTYLPMSTPDELETVAGHLGAELTELWPWKRGFLAVDSEWWEYRDWEPDLTCQLGIILGSRERRATWISQRMYLQFYTGRIMLGQYYDEVESHVAIGIGGTF